MKHLKITIGTLCMLAFASHVQAQIFGGNGLPASVNKPSENGEALGKYGSFPVGFYTGQPNINIPLYTVNYADISIPISLNYDASGIRVDQYPTWVGLGFSLQTGGVITRRVQGMPDDYMFPDVTNKYEWTEKGYMFCGNKLNLPNSDWYSQSTLSGFAPGGVPGNWNPNYLADGCPDDFNFNVGGYSGSFFLDETGTWRVKSKQNLGLEISHEVNANPVNFISCSNATVDLYKLITKFVIKTPDGTRYTFGGDLYSLDYSRAMRNDFNRFLYAAANSNISPTAWYLTKIETPTGAVINLTYDKGMNLLRHSRSASAYQMNESGYPTGTGTNQEAFVTSIITPCYLKSIETPNEKLDFYRSFTNEQMFYAPYPYLAWRHNGADQTFAEYERQAHYPTPGSPSAVGYELEYRAWTDFYCSEYDAPSNPRPLPSALSNQRIPNWAFKLDSVRITDKFKSQAVESISFTYTNDTTLRLFLNEVKITTPNTPQSKYAFTYIEPTLVPNYCYWTKDQWGYNNGVNYTMDPNTGNPPANMYNSDTWRLADATKAQYGTLKKITFPTGGYTEFEYELNDYSQYQKVTMFSSAGLTGTTSLQAVSNTNAGGLRIRRIKSTANYNAPVVTKDYYYKKNYLTGGTVSSGILSGKSKYIQETKFYNGCDNGDIAYQRLCSDNAFLAWGEGDIKPVTYSEVTEKSSDGSATVYKYSNYETPGCLDEVNLPATILNATESDFYQLTSTEIERGLLLEEANYNNANSLVSKKVYEYEFDPNRKNKFAKCVRRADNIQARLVTSNFWPGASPCYISSFYRLYPYKKYYYNVPLKKITETLYENNGQVTQVSSFDYDQYGSKTSIKSNTSDGQSLVQSIKYNSHADYTSTATSPDAIGIAGLLVNYGIKNYPVEQLTLTTPQQPGMLGADRITSGAITVYDQNKPVMKKAYALELTESFAPVTYNAQLQPTYHFDYSKIANGNFVIDSRYKLQSTVNSFTVSGQGTLTKPTGIITKTGNVAFTWDHSRQYQTSSTQNALANEVAFSSFEGTYLATGSSDDNRGNWNFDNAYIVNNSFTGSKALDISAGNIVSVNTLSNGRNYFVSFWAQGTGNPQLKIGSTVLNQMYAPIKTVGNWKLYRIKITGNGGALTVSRTSTLGQSLLIDEVRLYPEGALMKSYTYNPFNGTVTSINDEADNLTFFSYDNLGRLTIAKDENGNIVKKHTYQTQGDQ